MEIETLKAYIIDLKARIAVYIPVKGDVIDRKLAEYINNFPDRNKLKIMFMRESSGVYEFGDLGGDLTGDVSFLSLPMSNFYTATFSENLLSGLFRSNFSNSTGVY